MAQQRTGSTPSEAAPGRQDRQERQMQESQQPDQERQRQVSREGGTAGAMQRGGRQPGSAVAGRGAQQPSLLPAFMTSPGLMASAFMSNPFAFAQAMSQEMDRLFSSLGGELAPARAGGWQQGMQGAQGARGAMAQWMPPMELEQRGDELVVRADLPGVSPDDVQIEVEDGVLTITGERRRQHEDRQEGFYRSERSYGSFTRGIPLPDDVDPDQVRASFEHGVLEVTVPLPRQQRQRGRRVQIQSGGTRQEARQETGKEMRTEAGRPASDRTPAP